MQNSFAIFRVQKLKQGRAKGSFARSWRHLERHTQSAKISHPELSQYNMYKVHPKVAQNGIKKVIGDIIDAMQQSVLRCFFHIVRVCRFRCRLLHNTKKQCLTISRQSFLTSKC